METVALQQDSSSKTFERETFTTEELNLQKKWSKVLTKETRKTKKKDLGQETASAPVILYKKSEDLVSNVSYVSREYSCLELTHGVSEKEMYKNMRKSAKAKSYINVRKASCLFENV